VYFNCQEHGVDEENSSLFFRGFVYGVDGTRTRGLLRDRQNKNQKMACMLDLSE